MRKHEEISNVNSCFNLALGNERMFVLLERDAAAPAAIRAWIEERIKSGKSQPDSPEIVEAAACAIAMEEGRPRVRRALGKS